MPEHRKERRKAMCKSKAEGGRRCKRSAGRKSSAATDDTGGSALADVANLIRRTRAEVLDDAKKQLISLLDAVVDAAPVTSIATLVSAADADVAGQIADAITATLQSHRYTRGKRQSHMLCGALAAAAHAMKAGEDAANAAVTKAITAALTLAGVPRLAAGLAARAAVNQLMKLTPLGHWEGVRRAVQLLAISICPNLAEHPAVEQYCVSPLASDFLSNAIQADLAALSGDATAAAS
jgi:hypothetical protein